MRRIADLAQRWLFLEGQSRLGSGGTGPDIWNIDKDVDCSDFTMDMGELLGDLGMAPDGAEELERKAKHEAFAVFVGDLMKDAEYRCADCGHMDDEDEFVPSDGNPAPHVCPKCGLTNCFAVGSADASDHHVAQPADDDALLGSMADAQAAADPDRTGPLERCQAEIDSMEERIPHHELPPRYDALVRRRNELEVMAAEELKRGDPATIIDGKVRLHDRAEAVKRLLAEYALWSGGFEPAECSNEERNTFLCGRDLDAAQEAAMWPERQAVRS